MEHKRLATWWITWEDLNWPSVDNMERIKVRAEKLAKANVTDVIIFGTHFRWDYLPFFTLLHDYLATVAEELHKYGVRLIDHHSVNLIHRYSTKEEMRHVMLHSGPHLPFSPSWEAAATWEYNGSKLNDWRMLDVKTGKPLWYPQYASEGFCLRNPEFIAAYQQYVKTLVKDTGIDGLMADDPIHYMLFNSCSCPHCRAELKRRSGIDLPAIEDQTFWGNWDNPAWKGWIDLRFDATGNFMQAVAEVLPENFLLCSCGASSAGAHMPATASDARKFLQGANYVNLEMSGNTPPYKHDRVTVNIPVGDRIVNASHHQAAAREKGVRCYGTGYGFTEAAANIIWAVNKTLDSDCWFSTLKARLGLPEHVLKQLPDEGDVIGRAFTYEKEHPELFEGEQVGQMAVYFSYETRNHTCFGNRHKGYSYDYRMALEALFRAGVSAHTVFAFPKDTAAYPLVLVPSPLSMTEQERNELKAYLAAGGKVVITGPCALRECVNSWDIPNHPDCAPKDFFSTIRDGVWVKAAEWSLQDCGSCADAREWQQPMEGLYYNPGRISEPDVADGAVELCRKCAKKMPLQVLEANGYYVTVFRNEQGTVLHFLAADYDVDIDRKLDEMRFHRSRVNYVNKVEPIGVTRTLCLAANSVPRVYLPFHDTPVKAQLQDGVCSIDLPEGCSYLIVQFDK